jgi:tripeptidyl-peptidase-1
MFFKEYVKDAEKGDEEVYAFEGDKDKENGQVEASLDIQYIMGVAPGIKTEFWLFRGGDFCADLVEWTNKLIADVSGPNVHSISYGWQGNLTQVQCTDAKVKVIDDNYAKLAPNSRARLKRMKT